MSILQIDDLIEETNQPGERWKGMGVAKFAYGIGPGGAYVVPTPGMPGQLCIGCMTEEEVDEQIQRLNGELDDVAWQMKKAIDDRGPSLLPKRS
jgi:hypothetical protein